MGGASAFVLDGADDEDGFPLVACALPSVVDALFAVWSLVVTLPFRLMVSRV